MTPHLIISGSSFLDAPAPKRLGGGGRTWMDTLLTMSVLPYTGCQNWDEIVLESRVAPLDYA